MKKETEEFKILIGEAVLARDRLLESIFSRTDVPQEVKNLATEFHEALNRQANKNVELVKSLERQYNHL